MSRPLEGQVVPESTALSSPGQDGPEFSHQQTDGAQSSSPLSSPPEIKRLRLGPQTVLYDLNKDQTNFQLKFEVQCVRQNDTILCRVLTQRQLDDLPPGALSDDNSFRAANGYMAGEISYTESDYQNHFLALRAPQETEVEVRVTLLPTTPESGDDLTSAECPFASAWTFSSFSGGWTWLTSTLGGFLALLRTRWGILGFGILTLTIGFLIYRMYFKTNFSLSSLFSRKGIKTATSTSSGRAEENFEADASSSTSSLVDEGGAADGIRDDGSDKSDVSEVLSMSSTPRSHKSRQTEDVDHVVAHTPKPAVSTSKKKKGKRKSLEPASIPSTTDLLASVRKYYELNGIPKPEPVAA